MATNFGNNFSEKNYGGGGATMPWKGIKPLRISKFYMQICPSENSIGYVVLTLIKLLSQ